MIQLKNNSASTISEFKQNNDTNMIKYRYPNFLIVLFLVEMWERFSFYGMSSLLMIFLTNYLKLNDQSAYAIYGLYTAICYAGPILGGFIADKLLGFKSTLIIGALLMIIGHTLMTFIYFEKNFLFLGLGFISVGTGFFKGNITNLLGICYDNHSHEHRSIGFTLFYVSVNLGALIATISCGFLAEKFGWHYGFGLAAIGMAIGLITLKKYEHIISSEKNLENLAIRKKISLTINTINYSITIFAIILAILASFVFKFHYILKKILQYVNNALTTIHPILNITTIFLLMLIAFLYYNCINISKKEERRNFSVLLIYILLFLIFFIFANLTLSSITLFTDRHINCLIFGIHIPTSVLQSINPLVILSLGIIYGIRKKTIINQDYLIFPFAILSITICFFILYIGSINANIYHLINYKYLLISIAILSAGEFMLSPYMHNQVTILAPKNKKGFAMSILMLSIAITNLIGTKINNTLFDVHEDKANTINKIASLNIYKNGFLQITYVSLLLLLLTIALLLLVNYKLKPKTK